MLVSIAHEVTWVMVTLPWMSCYQPLAVHHGTVFHLSRILSSIIVEDGARIIFVQNLHGF